ncbi:Photosystem I P700 chlorophyll a apoprotein A1 [Frankliniella fusca]|uniref:Photosystem I P700 chlorophyll a apoprotein A1 n=1 Tax=Frankliniella fusca TaxID=407009 RepID=A0AAE1HJT6_9NEOP|nr:Photosystem I P700 chlorophyll a apoprotein A1 [Frankliniella fusca]
MSLDPMVLGQPQLGDQGSDSCRIRTDRQRLSARLPQRGRDWLGLFWAVFCCPVVTLSQPKQMRFPWKRKSNIGGNNSESWSSDYVNFPKVYFVFC